MSAAVQKEGVAAALDVGGLVVGHGDLTILISIVLYEYYSYNNNNYYYYYHYYHYYNSSLPLFLLLLLISSYSCL